MRSPNHPAVLLMLVVLFYFIPVATEAQSTGEARQLPAPWRPSFGSLQNSGDSLTQMQPFTQPAATTQDPADANGSTSEASGSNSQFALESRPQNTRNDDQSTRVAQGSITRVKRTMDMLPNGAGQVWREYDISPYTNNIKNNESPQQAILDWILRETGTEMWFNQPMGILNADRNHIYVYHTPEIQNEVRKIVDRFVHTRGQVQTVDINLVTVEKPNWRSNVYNMLQPVDVQSPGVEAWLISKENAAMLLSRISRRSDFQQHSSGRLTAHDGQNLVLSKTQPRQFVRNIRWIANQYPNYQPLMTTVDEGYKLSISSLSSLDNSIIEATIKCDVDQVEKLQTVKVDVPSAVAGRPEQMNLQIPQIISWRLHERFRWPNDQVLLLSCGVVAKPEAQAQRPGNLPRLFNTNRNRADALLFIEYRGPAFEGQLPNPVGAIQPISLSQTIEPTSLEPSGFRQE